MSDERDYITVEDEDGIVKRFAVEALFDMEDETYALIKNELDDDDTIVLQVEEDPDGQYLVGINNPKKVEMVLNAYEIAVNANPAD